MMGLSAKSVLVALAAAYLAAAYVTPAWALLYTGAFCADTNNSCTLEELLPGGAEFRIDDKVFSDWLIVGDQFSVDTGNIVFTLVDSPGSLEPGPGFDIDFGTELDTTLDNISQEFREDFEVRFVVTVDPIPLVLSALSITGTLTSTCSDGDCDPTQAFAASNISLLTQRGSVIENPTIRSNDPDNPAMPDSTSQKSYYLTPLTADEIIIQYEAECMGSSAEIDCDHQVSSPISVRISQAQVSEPFTLVIFGTGLAAIGWMRRRTIRNS